MADNEKKESQEIKKIGFFKKVWYSMTKFEKYPEMAAEGMSRAFVYLIQIMLIFSLIVSLAYVFKFYQVLQDQTQLDEYLNSAEISDKLTVELVENGLNVKLNETGEELTYSLNEIYGMSFLVVYMYVIVIYSLSVLVDALLIAVLGRITLLFTKLKLRFSAVYNMSIYSLTISILLNSIYILVNTITGFEMSYFYVMYTSIAYVCLVAAIFMIKLDFIKRQAELMKIMEEQKKVREEMEEQERKKEPASEEKKPEEKEKTKEGNEEPNGSEA